MEPPLSTAAELAGPAAAEAPTIGRRSKIRPITARTHEAQAALARSEIQEPPSQPDLSAIRAALLEEHNRNRAEADLPPLKSNPKLDAAGSPTLGTW